MNFEQIIGDEIRNIFLLVDDDIINPIYIEQILIETLNNKISIGVNKDFDEVILKVDNSLNLDFPNSDQSIIKVGSDSDAELNNLINKKIIWTWNLNNNQGYNDAFQIEVTSDDISYIYQFLVVASRIEIYRLDKR